MREAAAAFDIPVKPKGIFKRKQDLVNEIMTAVGQGKKRKLSSGATPSHSGSDDKAKPTSALGGLSVQGDPPATGDAGGTLDDGSAGDGLQERYDASVWGMARQSKGGRGRAQAVSSLDGASAKWDLFACRSLLLSLEPSDLERRLQNSPWRQGKAPNEISWLKEAAVAFTVPLKQSQAQGAAGTYKVKGAIIDDIKNKVAAARAIRIGTSAGRDEQRRQTRMASLSRRADVRAARKRIALLPTVVGMDFQQMRDDVLLFECSESLRMSMVVEFIEGEQRTPCVNGASLAEQRAA